MVRSQSRVGANGARALAVVALAVVAFAIPLLASPATALAYYGQPTIDDTYTVTVPYYCQVADPGSSMTPAAFAMAADGTMWIAENDAYGLGRSALVHRDGSGLLLSGGGTLPAQYAGLTSASFGPDGKLYLGCLGTHSVLVYDLQTASVVSQIGGPAIFDWPVDLEFDTSGNLFVVDRFAHVGTSVADGKVVRFNSTFTSHTEFNGESSPDGALSFPMGLCIDSLGNAWVADSYNNRIIEFDNSGLAVLANIRPQYDNVDTLVEPQDVCVDWYGTLNIVDQKNYSQDGVSGRFVRYAADGTFLGEYRGKGVGFLNSPSKIWVNSPVYGGDVFINDQIEDTGSGVAGLVERWGLTEGHPDLTAPVTTDDAPAGWQRATVQVALSAEDTQSGLASTVWGYSPESMSSYTSTITVSAEGTTTIYYRSVDRAGNVENPHTINVRIDRNAPETLADVPPIFYDTVSGSLTASDSVSGLAGTMWRTDGGQWVSGTDLSLPSSFGAHSLSWYSTDHSGLVEATHTITYQVLRHTEQDDWRVLNQGTWSLADEAAAFGGSFGTADTLGSRSIVTFKGTRLDYYATLGPAYGIARVRIDNGISSYVDLYSASTVHRDLVWTTGPMTDTTHTIDISYTGQKNSSSASDTISVDAFDTSGFVGQADTEPPYTEDDVPAGWTRPDLYVTLSATDTVSGVSHTYYSTNGSTPSVVYSAPIKFSADGITTLLYRTIDRVGNTEATRTATVRVDGTAPVTTCTVQPDYLDSATIVLVPTDPYSGVAQTVFSLDGSASTSGTVVNTTSAGTHTLAYRSTDLAGNTEPTQTIVFDVLSRHDQDTAEVYYRGPWSSGSQAGAYRGTAASLNAAGGAYFSFTGKRLELSAATGPGMGLAQVVIDGAPAGTIDFYSAAAMPQQRVYAIGGLSTGWHTAQILWLGTKNPDSAGTSIELDAISVLGLLGADTTEPDTTDYYDGLWHEDSYTLVINAADAGSWVATTHITVNGVASVYTGPLSITDEGTTTVQYWSVDGAGNVESTHTVHVRVDDYLPSSADDLPATWSRTPITVTLTASDTASGVQKILYTVGTSSESVYSAPFVVSQEGSTSVEYYAVDKVTHAEPLHTSYALIDMSAPVTTDDAPLGWARNTVDLELSTTDTYSGVAQTLYGLNGAAPTNVASAPIQITADGTTTVAYRSTDVAGNVEATRSATVRIDTAPPHTSSDSTSSYPATATVMLTPTDSTSGVASTRWRIDSGEWTTGTVATLPFVAGQHMLQWASTDVAGNTEATQSATYQMMQRWEQTDSRFYFRGPWVLATNGVHSGNSLLSANTASAAVFLGFTGTRFDLISRTGPGYGIARVTIDETATTDVDLYSAANAYQARVFSAPGLANGAHTVRVEWTGTKNLAAIGTTVSVDAVDLIGQLNTDTVAPMTTSDASFAWRSTNATVTLTATDAHSFVANSFYRIGGTTSGYSGPFAVSTEGTTSIQFWSVDAAGNTEASSTATVRIDRTAPATMDDAPAAWVHGPVAVHLTSTDSGSGVGTIRYSVDGTDPSLVATGGIVTVSAEGTTTLKYRGIDAIGNAEAVKTATVRIDNAAPGTNDNAAAGWVKAPALVTLTASDGLSGVANTYYSTDGSNPALVASGPVSISANGTTTLKYYSSDVAGNAETVKTTQVRADALAPVTTATVQPEYMTSATVTLAATDTESGVSATYWRIDGGSWTAGSVAATSTGGTHLLEYYSVDVVGNIEGVRSAFFDVAIHYESGSSYISRWPSAYWYNASGSYSGGAERYTSYRNGYSQFVFNGTGFHLIASRAAGYGTGTITIDGETTYTVDFGANPTGTQLRVFNITGLTDTQHSVRLTCSNTLGKQIRFDAVDIIGKLNTSADLTPPSTSSNVDTLWHKGSFAVALTANDSLSDVAGTYYALNGGVTQSYAGAFTVSTEGTNTLEFYSVDTAPAANREDTNTVNVLVDTSAPVTSNDAPAGWQTSPVTVHLSATDACSGVAGTRYTVNGSAVATYAAGIPVIADGTTTIAYASTDAVGNWETTKTVQVKLDRAAPVTGSDVAESYPTTVAVTLTPADSVSGVASTQWRLDGAGWNGGTVVSATPTLGTHLLEWRSTDAAGNVETTRSATFEVLTRYEQADSLLHYRAAWTYATSAARSGGSWSYSANSGAAVYVNFTGTRVDYITSTGGSQGIAKVTLDGSQETTIDLYTASFKHKVRVFSATDLADTQHVLKIEWTGQKNPASSGTVVGIDAVDIAGTLTGDAQKPVTHADHDEMWQQGSILLSLAATDTGTWVNSTHYRIGSTTTTYTAPFAISAEGTTAVEFWSVDGAGNTEAPQTVNVRIDRIAPATSDDARASWVRGPALVTLDATDGGSGVASTLYSADGTTPTIPATGAVSIAAEGTSTLRYHSVDIAGNVEESKLAMVYVDSTAPESTDDAPDTWVDGPVDVAISATDALSGVVGVRVSVDGSVATTYAGPISITDEGTTTIAYSAVDAAGNSETTKTATVRVDHTAPVTGDNAPLGWSGGPVTLTLTPTDPVSGPAMTYYSTDGSHPTLPYSGPIVITAQGTTVVKFYSVDVKGNAEPVGTKPISIDDGAPSTSDDAPASWVHGPVSLTLTATDTVSGVGTTLYSLDGTYPSHAFEPPLSIIAEGTTTLKYLSVDVKGNAENVTTKSVRIDNNAPETGSNAETSYLETATIALSAEDAHSGVASTMWSLDGAAPTTGTIVSTSAAGHHTLQWRSIDVVGNIEDSHTAEFDVFKRIDDTNAAFVWRGTWANSSAGMPYGAGQRTANSSGASAYFTFVGPSITLISSKGPDLGIASVSIDGGAPTDVDLYNSLTPSQQKPFVSPTLSQGSHTIAISWTGRKNPSSSGTKIAIDAFDILGTTTLDAVPPITNAIVDPAWFKGSTTVTLTASDAANYVAATYYRVNGGVTTTYTAPFAVSAEGTVPVAFWSVDGVGNVESTSTVYVHVDNSAPQTSHDAPGTWTHAPATVHLTATDSMSGVDRTYYSLDGSAPSILATAATVIAGEGITTLKYYSVDAVGNAETVKSVQIRADKTPPFSTTDAITAWQSAPITVHVSASDSLSGVAGTRYALNGSPAATYTPSGFVVSAEGTTTVGYASVDNVGNWESTRTVQARIDYTAPVTSSDATESYVGTITMTLSPADAGSGVQSTAWRIDGGAWNSGTAVSATATPAQVHTVEWRSTDKVGNVESIRSVDVKMLARYEQDDARLVYRTAWTSAASSSRSGGSWAYSSTSNACVYVTFTGTRVDYVTSTGGNAGLAKVTLDGSQETTVDLYSASFVHKKRVYSAASLADGPHTLKVEWTGQKNPSSSGTVVSADAFDVMGSLTGDIQAPTTVSDYDGTWRADSVWVALSASDADSFVALTRYRIDAGMVTTYTVPFSVSAEGTTTASFQSVDAAGNTETTKSVSVRIDRTAPTSSIDATSAWMHGPATLHISALDTMSGVAHSLYSLDETTPTLLASGPISVTAEGTTTVRFASTDHVGNAEAPKSAVVRIDDTAPVSTDDAPGPSWTTGVRLMTADTLSGVGHLYYSSDGSFPTVSYSDAVAFSADGTRTLKYYATDAAGNMESLHSKTVYVDQTSPVTSATVLPSYTGTATIALTPIDALSGVTSTEWRLDNGAWQSGTTASCMVGGVHTLEWRSTDAVGNLEPTKSATFSVVQRFEQDDAHIAYRTAWTNASSTARSGNSWTYTANSGSAAYVNFVGTRVDCLTSKGNNAGLMKLTLDGGTPVTVDLYNASFIHQRQVYSATGLVNGPHELRIEWTGQKNAASSGTVISLDALDIVGTLSQSDIAAPVTTATVNPSYLGTATVNLVATDAGGVGVAYTKWRLNSSAWTTGTVVETSTAGTYALQYYSVDAYGNAEVSKAATLTVLARYEETDSKIIKPGEWTYRTSGARSANAWAYVNTPDGAINLTFTGTQIRYLTSKGTDSGIVRITLDNTSTVLVDLYSSSWIHQQTVWSAAGLSNGTHTLKIERTGTMNPGSSNAVMGLDAFDVAGALLQTDFTAPTATSDLAPAYVAPATVTIKPKDTASGVAWTKWRIDGGTWQAGTSATLPYAVGDHVLSYQVADLAGNISAEFTADYAILRRYEQTASQLRYSGAWTAKSGSARSGGSWASTVETGAAMTADFTGTRLDLVASKTPGAGILSVAIDGGVPTQVDLYSPSYQHQKAVWSARDLGGGQHQVVVTCLGERNPLSTGTDVGVDAIDAIGTLVLIDTVPPTTQSDAASSYREEAIIALSATDAASPIASTTWSLDGGPVHTGASVSVPFSLGSHTLEFRSTDAQGNAEATKTATFVMVNRYEQDDALVSYSGSWTTTSSAARSGGSWTYANAEGVSATFSFNGTTAIWLTSKAPNAGVARVTVDNQAPVLVDLYSTSWVHKVAVWNSGALADGPHSVRIEWTGDANPSASGSVVGIDALDIAGELSAP